MGESSYVFFLILIRVLVPRLKKLQVSSIRTTCFQNEKKTQTNKNTHTHKQQEKIKQAIDRIHGNASAYKCKQDHDIMETKTVVQLLNLPYSPDLSLRDIFQKNNFYRHDVNSSLKVLLVVPLLSVHSVSPNKSTYLQSESAF